MSRFGSLVLAALTSLPLLIAGEAQAYDAENTHRWIAREAVQLLVSTYPGEYDELLEHIEEVADGASHEDDLYLDGDDDPRTLRVMRHFYHAPDATGLSFDGQQFPSSYEWNALDNPQNEWDYHDGMRAFQFGEFAQAYFIAGHTIHLIADLTVPAHSHLDDHGPPTGDNYEDHCTSRMVSQFEGTLKRPAPDAIIPAFLDLKDAFQKTANTSYYRNMYPGNLQGDTPSGVVGQMFPDMSTAWISGNWVIDGIGEEGEGFYEEQPGYYYFSRNLASPLYDITNYDPSRPLERTYGPVTDEAMMVERMADDLVPVAILHSASVLKMFVDEARSLPSKYKDNDLAPAESGGCSTTASSSSTLLTLCFAAFFLFSLRRRSEIKGQ
jgi:hypothetical protein